MKPEAASAEELLREMQSSVLPVDSPDVVQHRRSRTISRLRGAQARSRIEQSSVQKRRRHFALAAALLAPAAAAAFAFHVGRNGPAAPMAASVAHEMRVRALTGHLDVVHDGRLGRTEVGVSTPLTGGDAIRTEPDSIAALTMPSEAAVEMSSSTSLRVTLPDAARTEWIELASGRVDVSVPKLAPGKKLSVHTPHAMVTVHGTRFSVAVIENGGALETDVAVDEGAVLVERDGRTVEIHAGDSWSSAAGTPVGRNAAPQVGTERTAEAARSGRAAGTRSVHLAAIDGAMSKRGAPSVVAAREGAAASASRSADFSSSTLSEENKLMERAMVASRQGNDRDAVALLDALLGRYPHSILKENAQVERFRTLRRLGDLPGASRGARRYLAEHPDGPGRDEAQGLAVEPTDPRAR
jgi:hypothetical protein